MKRKLIVLFICLAPFSFLAAQSSTREVSQIADKSITVSDLMDYAEECYNDSTMMSRVKYVQGKDTFVYVIPPEKVAQVFIRNYTMDTVYTHREPTFQGFMEYLNSN